QLRREGLPALELLARQPPVRPVRGEVLHPQSNVVCTRCARALFARCTRCTRCARALFARCTRSTRCARALFARCTRCTRCARAPFCTRFARAPLCTRFARARLAVVPDVYGRET